MVPISSSSSFHSEEVGQLDTCCDAAAGHAVFTASEGCYFPEALNVGSGDDKRCNIWPQNTPQ